MAASSGALAATHSALQSSQGLPSDVFPDTFDWFFAHAVFQRWSSREGKWQLHCIGGPGTGKTTLAAFVSEHLEKNIENGKVIVISVFVQEDVLAYEIEFLEDFLIAIYRKLEEYNNAADKISNDLFNEYVQARVVNLEGCRVARRVQLIRKAVYSRLSGLPQSVPAYLVFDGLDRCSSTLRLLFDMELLELQQRGLSSFITSRIAVFDQLVTPCDHRNHDGRPDDDPIDEEDREILDQFLVCRTCDHVLCFPCKDAGRVCGICGNNNALYEPYDHVNIRIGQIADQDMRKLIAWSLEREHGDLKLGSPARKPPLSALGAALLEDPTPNSAQALVDRIADVTYGNIGLAKARLDLVHEAESILSVETRRDRLPANIVAIFDAGLSEIERQIPEQRDLGLKALAAAGRDSTGISIPLMQRLLHNSILTHTRSGEDIINAARGFLFATTTDNPQKLQLYHPNFLYYVVQRYNVGIYRANSQLTVDNLRRKASSYDMTRPFPEPRVRFEPLTMTEEPAEVTPYKLSRTMTALEHIEEAPGQAFILRKGTRAWK